MRISSPVPQNISVKMYYTYSSDKELLWLVKNSTWNELKTSQDLVYLMGFYLKLDNALNSNRLSDFCPSLFIMKWIKDVFPENPLVCLFFSLIGC